MEHGPAKTGRKGPVRIPLPEPSVYFTSGHNLRDGDMAPVPISAAAVTGRHDVIGLLGRMRIAVAKRQRVGGGRMVVFVCPD